MKFLFYTVLFFISALANAQVGIGTSDPQATLDIRDPNPSSPTAAAGIAIPQVGSLPASGNRAGQLLYLTTTNLFYCYNGSFWMPLSNQIFTLGDVKNGYQASDHNGWVLLNGRLKSTLSTSQQAVATSLGIGTNLPDLRDKSIVGASVTKALNTTGGSSSLTIAQNQLPNVTLTTSTDGAHSHTGTSGTPVRSLLSLSILGQYILQDPANTATSTNGAHSHVTSSINGNVAQQSLNIQNSYLALNGFIYLGL